MIATALDSSFGQMLRGTCRPLERVPFCNQNIAPFVIKNIGIRLLANEEVAIRLSLSVLVSFIPEGDGDRVTGVKRRHSTSHRVCCLFFVCP